MNMPLPREKSVDFFFLSKSKDWPINFSTVGSFFSISFVLFASLHKYPFVTGMHNLQVVVFQTSIIVWTNSAVSGKSSLAYTNYFIVIKVTNIQSEQGDSVYVCYKKL